MPLAFLFPFSCMAIWSGNAIVSKLAVGLLSPAALAWSRWMVAAIILTPFLAHRAWRDRAKLRAGFYQLAALALLGMVLNQTLGYYAAQTLGATEIGLMMGLTPLMTVLLSIWLLRERPTWGALLGGLISILGLTILLGQGDPSRLFIQGIHIGSVYMLLSAGTYALYSVLLKKWDLGLDNWSMLYGQVLCSLLFLTPFYLLVDGQWPDGRALWLILYAGIPTSALSPWLWMQGIALLGASRTAIFMNLLPVMTAALAISWLGETLTSYHLIGGGMTLLGVLLAQLLVQPVVLRRRAMVALASCRED
ncbi:EamA family transporter [Aeromonas sp. 2HA2]|uniref:DMT family transporter n=1 Tax=unclassified Aeromonas TaxID=257493 RepID=UPI0023DDDDCE|nr:MULTISPECIES: DMT family transporter [unclassified Aeromonas]MDF2390796.1 EamA family transporter [Aeromonas sp. 2MA4]MDF2409294.1 EamA family transporter [Aeromonas sp. 2HA2]